MKYTVQYVLLSIVSICSVTQKYIFVFSMPTAHVEEDEQEDVAFPHRALSGKVERSGTLIFKHLCLFSFRKRSSSCLSLHVL